MNKYNIILFTLLLSCGKSSDYYQFGDESKYILLDITNLSISQKINLQDTIIFYNRFVLNNYAEYTIDTTSGAIIISKSPEIFKETPIGLKTIEGIPFSYFTIKFYDKYDYLDSDKLLQFLKRDFWAYNVSVKESNYIDQQLYSKNGITVGKLGMLDTIEFLNLFYYRCDYMLSDSNCSVKLSYYYGDSLGQALQKIPTGIFSVILNKTVQRHSSSTTDE